MADITHGTWIKDGKAVDAVYQSGVKVYGRNLLTNLSSNWTKSWGGASVGTPLHLMILIIELELFKLFLQALILLTQSLSVMIYSNLVGWS